MLVHQSVIGIHIFKVVRRFSLLVASKQEMSQDYLQIDNDITLEELETPEEKFGYDMFINRSYRDYVELQHYMQQPVENGDFMRGDCRLPCPQWCTKMQEAYLPVYGAPVADCAPASTCTCPYRIWHVKGYQVRVPCLAVEKYRKYKVMLPRGKLIMRWNKTGTLNMARYRTESLEPDSFDDFVICRRPKRSTSM